MLRLTTVADKVNWVIALMRWAKDARILQIKETVASLGVLVARYENAGGDLPHDAAGVLLEVFRYLTIDGGAPADYIGQLESVLKKLEEEEA